MSSRLHHRALAAALVASAIAAPALAQESPAPDSTVASKPAPPRADVPRFRGLVRFGLDGGGDKYWTFEFEDGSKSDMTAGGGGVLSAGIAYRPLQTKLGGIDAQLDLGVKYRTIPETENQSASWMRFPLEAKLLFRGRNGMGIGGGVTTHLGNKLRTSGDVGNESVTFDAAPGYVAQAEYAWKGAIFDLRYTALRYQISNASGAPKVDASSIGAGITILFGKGGIVHGR